jgi:hypothetical protein
MKKFFQIRYSFYKYVAYVFYSSSSETNKSQSSYFRCTRVLVITYLYQNKYILLMSIIEY